MGPGRWQQFSMDGSQPHHGMKAEQTAGVAESTATGKEGSVNTSFAAPAKGMK